MSDQNVRCIGCGGILQNTDKDKPFYTPKTIEEGKEIYCQRCYRMRHYGEVIPTQLDEDDYRSVLDAIDPEALIVKVIDLFDIEGSIIPSIGKIPASGKVFIVANKRDVLPKNVRDSKIAHTVKKVLADYGIKAQDVVIVSAKKNWNIDTLLDRMAKAASGRDIYLVGATNAGKSTLLNHMIQATAERSVNPITTFYAPGTTQGFIPIPFEENTLYDTPGLFKSNHLNRMLSAKAQKAVQPKGEIKPIVYQLEVNQTIFIGALARIDFIRGLPSSFIFYVSPDVTVHRTKMINADQFYDKHAGSSLTPPYDDERIPSFKVHQFPLQRETKTDIVIPGLGFVSVKGTGIIRLYTPEGITAYQREALI
ncbi:MAG: ribosome biogenesis GTPase YqeH [Bacillota bacterium]